MPEAPPFLEMTGPAALRALARAFGHFHEFDRFVSGLQAALDQTDHFERLTIQLDRALVDGAAHFSPGVLTLPLAGGAARHGTLQATPGGQRRQFGAEDLHLLAGLADFLSATLTQSLRLKTAEQNRELLRFLLNQAPVGIAAYTADRRLIVANDLVGRWLGDQAALLTESLTGSGGFHLRAEGKLIYGEARAMPTEVGGWLVVLQDLTPEQARWHELVQRETYRALAEGRRLGLALVTGTQLSGGVLSRLPALRAALLPTEAIGPYDAYRLGLLFPATDGLLLRARLRKLRGLFADTAGLRVGYAELGRDGRTPETLLAAALERHGAYDDAVRPALLVHDDNAAVADTLAMVLGRNFRVVPSTALERTRALLAAEPFEGFVTEVELRNGASGLELARYAREQHPGIRPFFTTVQQPPYELPAGMAETEAIMLGKPFDVTELTSKVRARLAE